MRWKIYIPIIVRYLLIILFVYAALSKLVGHEKFYNDLRNSPIFGHPYISTCLSWMVPIAELMVALLLAFPGGHILGLYGALILMLAFTLYVLGILLFSESLPCSCGGVINNFTWQQHLMFNFVTTLLNVVAIYLVKKDGK